MSSIHLACCGSSSNLGNENDIPDPTNHQRVPDGVLPGGGRSSWNGTRKVECQVHLDTVLPRDAASIAWCHHNIESIWERNLRHTGLAEEIPKHRDPLLHRTFGALIRGDGMRPESDLVLASVEPSTDHRIRITVLTDFANSPADWRREADALAARTPVDSAARFAAHRDWWHAFWDRSWISIDDGASGTKVEPRDAQMVSQAYALQRYVNACAGRGKLPIRARQAADQVQRNLVHGR